MLKKFAVVVVASVLLQSCTTAMQAQKLEQGKQSFASGDYKQSFHELLPLANEGNARAQYAVGYQYYYGYGVAQDTESGVFWMQKAAAQHYQPAVQALQVLNSDRK